MNNLKDPVWPVTHDSNGSLELEKLLGEYPVIFNLCSDVCAMSTVCLQCALAVHLQMLTQVFSCSFWMGAFNGKTAKRHRLWSNDRGLLDAIFAEGALIAYQQAYIIYGMKKLYEDFDRWVSLRYCNLHAVCTCGAFIYFEGGHMTLAALQSLPGACDGLVRKYVDKRGQKRHVGVPEKLRKSQCLDASVMWSPDISHI